MTAFIIQVFLITLFATASYLMAVRVRASRNSLDVFQDLTYVGPVKLAKRGVRASMTLGDDLSKVGLFSDEDRKAFDAKRRLIMPVAFFVVGSFLFWLRGIDSVSLIGTLVIGGA